MDRLSTSIHYFSTLSTLRDPLSSEQQTDVTSFCLLMYLKIGILYKVHYMVNISIHSTFRLTHNAENILFSAE